MGCATRGPSASPRMPRITWLPWSSTSRTPWPWSRRARPTRLPGTWGSATSLGVIALLLTRR
eukprot:9488506-Lingulodinium_polyedra.AAC.1